MISLLMQMQEGYTDGHHGEWIMQPDQFAKAFRIYWDADYQIHIPVNGDQGLDMVLEIPWRKISRNILVPITAQ